DHILWRQENMPVNASVIASITSPPLFDSINTFQRYYSFRLKATSPGIKAGISCGVNIDLDGYQRPQDMPDFGCYQKH
ncbi:MAG TPA: hypothetical protein VGO09_09770, partial [Flavisolibacter sp.]|nr:hypothetical protein [Flavisolibacter sp.]